jgi:hypothetical protein
MRLCLFVTHQQKYMNKLLREFKWKITICYIDDIIIFSNIFKQHVKDLDDILIVLKNADLILCFQKCLVRFHFLKILEIIIDKYGLSTTKERAVTIYNQTYFIILQLLNIFIGQCGFLRNQILYYAQIMTFL